jgi:hypothetical protein
VCGKKRQLVVMSSKDVHKPPFWRRFFTSSSNLDTNDTRPDIRRVLTQKNLVKLAPGKPPPEEQMKNRGFLQNYLKQQSESPDLHSVYQLGLLCLEEGTTGKTRNAEMVYYSALLMEWANARGLDQPASEIRKLAYAHYEAWLTRGVRGEVDLILSLLIMTISLD